LLVFSKEAAAAEWSMEPSVSLNGAYDDNPLLLPVRHPATGSTLSPSLNLGVRTEPFELQGNLLVNLTRYFTQKDLDTTDQYYTVSSRYQMERNSLELQSSYTRDLTLTSELIETGQVLNRSRRDLFTLNPKWIGSLTENFTLHAEYDFSDALYASPSLVDYQTHLGTVQAVYQSSERDQATVSSYYSTYQALTADFRSLEYGAKAGLTHRFSETFHGDATAGIRSTTSIYQTTLSERRDRGRGWVGQIDLEKEFETVHVQSGFSRETHPSGIGYLVEVNHLNFLFRKTMTTKLTASLAVDSYLSRPLRTDRLVPNSRYDKIEQRWDWQWAERWSSGVSYRYAEQAVYNAPGRAISNAVFLITTYNGPRMAISR